MESDSTRLARVEAELKVLKDKDEIYGLLMRYARGVDRCDLETLAPIQRLDKSHPSYSPGLEADQIIKYLVEGSKLSMHFMGNCWIEVKGDRAKSETSFMSFLVFDKGGVDHLRTRAGRYLHQFERIDGRWYARVKEVIDDWSTVAPMPEGMAGKLVRGQRGRSDPVFNTSS